MSGTETLCVICLLAHYFYDFTECVEMMGELVPKYWAFIGADEGK
jgi:hypothetical protein